MHRAEHNPERLMHRAEHQSAARGATTRLRVLGPVH